MWPSSRPWAATGSSRLTFAPRSSAPRLVRRNVSGTTSIEKRGPAFFTTVRQHPLTATLAPMLRRREVKACSIVSRLRPAVTTVPTALTIPVNNWIAADLDVISETDEVDAGELGRIVEVLDPPTAQRPWCWLAADELRRDVGVDLVDQSLREERGVDLAAAFDQEADEVALAELVEEVGQRDATVFGRRQLQRLRQSGSARLRG